MMPPVDPIEIAFVLGVVFLIIALGSGRSHNA